MTLAPSTLTPPALTFSDAEETVALARLRVEGLVAALSQTPIDRDLYTELAAFLDDAGWRACDALDELRATSPTAKADRIAELLAGTKHDPRDPR